MDEVVEGSFLTGFFTYNVNVAESGIANLTVQEFHKRLVQEKSYRQESASFEFISGNCYDAVWGIALALNCTWNILEKSGEQLIMHLFNSTICMAAELIRVSWMCHRLLIQNDMESGIRHPVCKINR